MNQLDLSTIRKRLLVDARAIGIPSGAAKTFVNSVLTSLQKSLSNKTIITDRDLNRLIVAELKKYNPDLAYIYQNRDKII